MKNKPHYLLLFDSITQIPFVRAEILWCQHFSFSVQTSSLQSFWPLVVISYLSWMSSERRQEISTSFNISNMLSTLMIAWYYDSITPAINKIAWVENGNHLKLQYTQKNAMNNSTGSIRNQYAFHHTCTKGLRHDEFLETSFHENGKPLKCNLWGNHFSLKMAFSKWSRNITLK